MIEFLQANYQHKNGKYIGLPNIYHVFYEGHGCFWIELTSKINRSGIEDELSFNSSMDQFQVLEANNEFKKELIKMKLKGD